VALARLFRIALTLAAAVAAAEKPNALSKDDVSPYWATPDLAPARVEFERGRFRKAQQLLGAQGEAIPVRYLWAQSALRAGDVLAAANELVRLADRSPELRAYCLAQAAQAFERAGRPNEAATHYAAVARDSMVFSSSRWALARVLRKKGDLVGTGVALAALTEPSAFITERDRTEAWVALAALSKLRGRPGDERRAWLALWATEPLSALALRPEAREAGRWASDRWKVIRAQALLAQNLNREALKLLDGLVGRYAPPERLGCRAFLAYGTALRKERRHPAAIASLSAVVERCGAPELRPEAMYVLGYSQSVVAPLAAIETYESLASEYPDHRFADDALFFAADLRLRRGELDAPMAALGRIVERYPTGDFAAAALFKRFWVLRSGGTHDEASRALKQLEQLETLAPDAVTFEQQQQARYWRSRLLQRADQHAQAHALLAQVAVEGATTYYGLLARIRLNAQDSAFELAPADPTNWPEQVWPLDAQAVASDPHFRTGLELVRLGNPAGAYELLSVRKRRAASSVLRVVFHVLRVTGYTGAARVAARQLVREGVRVPTREEARLLYEIGYPDTFRELVERHSEAAQVDPDLMQALIREESAFNPRARSATGALGLAQLMPGTALQVAHSLRRTVTPRGLFDPTQNIRLGSAYLGDLSRQFDGNWAHAVASYNAGPRAVNRWLKVRPGAQLDEWVETIPIDETRRYVKRVLGSYGAYQLLSDAQGTEL
jgi:soluble lytic murein transglycosylase